MTKQAETIETAEIEVIAFAPEELMVTDDIVPMDLVIVDEPGTGPKESADYEKTQDLSEFMNWITKKMNNLPPHSGKTTAGCERVIAHLKMLDKEISKAISRDVNCVLDDQAVEKFRKDIRKMIKKLDKRHKEINEAYDADDDKFAANNDEELVKNADESWKCPECEKIISPGDEEHKIRHNASEHGHEANDKKASACLCQVKTATPQDENCPACKIKLWNAGDGMYECISCDAVFEGQITKEANTPKIQLVMSPLERALTGILINGYVSQGKQIEPAFAELKKAYKLTDREELSIMQLLLDMGFPTARNFMGMPHSNSVEFTTNYHA